MTDHYTKTEIEPIDVIEAWDLDFKLGCVIKYIARYRNKGGMEDLAKALNYMHRVVTGAWFNDVEYIGTLFDMPVFTTKGSGGELRAEIDRLLQQTRESTKDVSP